MTIEQLGSVDAVAVDRHGNAVLTISDHLAWDHVDAHLFRLQEKINTYLEFIESGALCDKHPEITGRRVIISLVLKFPVSADAQWFFTKMTKVIDAAGFGFEVRPIGSETMPQ